MPDGLTFQICPAPNQGNGLTPTETVCVKKRFPAESTAIPLGIPVESLPVVVRVVMVPDGLIFRTEEPSSPSSIV